MKSVAAVSAWNDCDLDDLAAGLPRPLVFTNGCFDLLHRGHVAYLTAAAALGNSLLVAVNDDASVRQLGKGDARPINNEQDRAHVLAALRSVDLIVLFPQSTPLELIKRIQPDVLVKGGDWPVDAIVGADEVRSRDGEVHSIPFEFDRSTTRLIERIRGVC